MMYTLSDASQLFVQMHYILDVTICPIYLALTLTSWSSCLVPFLQDLASHGKTRTDMSGTTDKITQLVATTKTQSTSPSHVIGLWNNFTNRILQGDFFLVPKRYFLHFYITGIISTVCRLLGRRTNLHCLEKQLQLPLALLVIHLVRRCYECCFVHKWTFDGKMHVAGYLLGIIHYVLLPSCFVPMVQKRETSGGENNDFEDNAINPGFLKENDHQSSSSSSSWVVGMKTACAVILCLIAQYEQYYHHSILASLRSDRNNTKSNKKSQDGNYRQIPLERGFQWISCPHYLAEIIIYVAFFILLQPIHHNISQNQDISSDQYSGWDDDRGWEVIIWQQLWSLQDYRPFGLLVWVSSNLIVSALNTHRWYTRNFDEYKTSKRKAILPFLL